VPLLRRDDLADEHLTSRAVARSLAAGSLLRVRPGVFVRAADVAALTPEERAVVRVRALDAAVVEPPVASHISAAAMHGLPLWNVHDKRVHVIAPRERPGAASGVVRHRGELEADDVVEVGGMLCTSLARTVADIARTSSFLTAACVADAALRQVAVAGPGTYDLDRADAFRRVAEEVAGRSAHGVARAMRLLAFADGRAQLPGESVSRVHLVHLGFATPRLQVLVVGPNGNEFWVDFGLDDVFAFGEFDGKGKYRDRLLRRGLTMAQVLDQEKQREDWIRGRTQRRFARWGGEHISTAMTLGDRLASFGIVPPRAPRR
jgi:hypothetical protein